LALGHERLDVRVRDPAGHLLGQREDDGDLAVAQLLVAQARDARVVHVESRLEAFLDRLFAVRPRRLFVQVRRGRLQPLLVPGRPLLGRGVRRRDEGEADRETQRGVFHHGILL
jgi:hypothetical protein